MFWWEYATAGEVFMELKDGCFPIPENFEDIDEFEGMSEQIWAIQEKLTENPWEDMGKGEGE